MAPYCIGSAPDRSCLFDEFLRYIQRVGKGTHLWTGSTSVGNNLKPDVLGTAQELDNGGTQGTPSRYSNTLAPSDIFPNLYFKGQSPDFSNLFGKVVDNIQECRQEMERKGRIDDIADELNSARHATKLFHSARIANQAEHVIEDVNKWLDETHQIQWKVDTRSRVAADGTLFKEIDVDTTIANHLNAKPGLDQDIRNYVKNYDQSNDKNRRHAAAIRASQSLSSRLHGLPSC